MELVLPRAPFWNPPSGLLVQGPGPAHQPVSTVLGCPAHQLVSTVLGCPAHQPVSTVLGCPAHQPVSTSAGMPCPPACEHQYWDAQPTACEHQYWDASGPAASQVGSQYHSLGGQVGLSTRRPTLALGPLDPIARDPRTQLCLPVGSTRPRTWPYCGCAPTPGPRDLAPPHQLTGTTLGIPWAPAFPSTGWSHGTNPPPNPCRKLSPGQTLAYPPTWEDQAQFWDTLGPKAAALGPDTSFETPWTPQPAMPGTGLTQAGWP